jgi:hypothetical protein
MSRAGPARKAVMTFEAVQDFARFPDQRDPSKFDSDHLRARGLGTLQGIHVCRDVLDRAELEAVRSARHAGASWTDVATALGVTRQAAWERWREVDATA